MNRNASLRCRGSLFTTSKRASLLLASFSAFPAFAQESAPATPAPQDASANEIIVTGVLNRTAKRDAAVAISTIDSDTVQRSAPVSAADLLKNVPGVYVNSSIGEARNIVYARGLSVGTQSATSGYYFVALLDDGLPVIGIQGSGFQPDSFYRQDLTLKRVEALRGGSATVTGPNAPGGLFNYISKNALTDHDGGIASVRIGLEGKSQPYQRADAYYGTEFGESGVYGSIGGFYRRSFGARPTAYPFNRGGQVKASLGWNYGAGSLVLYGKYLDDHNGSYDSERIPSIGFDDPQIAPGLSRYDNYTLGRKSAFTIPGAGAVGSQRFDPDNLDHTVARTVGLKWEHDVDDTLQISNHFRFNDNRLKLSQNGVGTFGLDNQNLWNNLGFSAAGLSRVPGTITVTGSDGQLLARVASAASGYTVLTNNLPNQQVLANGVISGAGTSTDFDEQSFIDQLTISKRIGRLTVTAGGYLSRSKFVRELLPPGGYIAPIMSDMEAAQVTFTDAATGNVYQMTNPAGFGSIGTAPVRNTVKNRSTSLFGGLNWKATDKLTLDAGIRYERFGYKGTNLLASANPQARDRTYGGVDGDPLTIYDNLVGVLNREVPFDKKLSFVNYTAAANYRFSERFSAYVRYARGKKNGDGLWGGYDTVFKAENQPITPPLITQYEAGFSYVSPAVRLTLTPFLTLLDKVNVVGQGTDLDGTTYVTTPAFNKTRVYGVEIEGDVRVTRQLRLTAAVTLQKGKALEWFNWNMGQTGRGDDQLEAYPDSKLENLAKVQGRIGVEYATGPFTALVNFTYLGSRPSSFTGLTTFPTQTQTDLSLSYDVTPDFRLGFNVNNVFNDIGIFSIQNPNLPISGLTQAQIISMYPDATTGILTTQPRSFFLTGTANF